METIDLGIKFVRGWNPGSGSDITSGIAQTGDINIALIVGLILLAMTIAGIIAYTVVKNKQFAVNSRMSLNYLKVLDFSNLSLQEKIIASIFGIVVVSCIVCGCFVNNAHAADEQSPLVPDKNTITATVAENGTFTLDTCTLTNTDVDKYTVEKSVVAIVQESSEIEGLEESEITVEGFNGTLYEGNPSGTDYKPQDLQDLEAGASTTLSFSISLPDDVDIETLLDKQVFNFTITTKIVIPYHDNLYQYSLTELQTVSRYLAKNYTEDSTDPVCVKFRNFRDSGLTEQGTDNGVPMDRNTNASNHWAIDTNEKLFGQEGFLKDDNSTIQARIIGICEDKDAIGKKIGLTFMTTHALSVKSVFEDDTEDYAKFGWAGSTMNGQCTLQSVLNSETASPFPSVLVSKVKPALKAYQYSNDDGSGQPLGYATVSNKFWAPSMKELYGNCYDEREGNWPNKNEGNQYKAFSENQISQTSYNPFENIDKLQDGTAVRANFVWSRSLDYGSADTACGVDGNRGGSPSLYIVYYGSGVVSCFCI